MTQDESTISEEVAEAPKKKSKEKDVTKEYRSFTHKCTGCGAPREWEPLKVVVKGDRIRVDARCRQCGNELPVELPAEEMKGKLR